jgi:hypothetical protein
VIIRMHLHRENLVGIKKLEKQWKRRWLAAAAKQFSWMVAQQITEALPSQGTVPDHALVIPAINQFPRLGVGASFAQLPAEETLKSAASPKVMAVEGRECQGRQHW